MSRTFPAVIIGMNTIARTFRVRRRTAMSWLREGAPIFHTGRMYGCDYDRLVDWLETTSHRRKPTIFEELEALEDMPHD